MVAGQSGAHDKSPVRQNNDGILSEFAGQHDVRVTGRGAEARGCRVRPSYGGVRRMHED